MPRKLLCNCFLKEKTSLCNQGKHSRLGEEEGVCDQSIHSTGCYLNSPSSRFNKWIRQTNSFLARRIVYWHELPQLVQDMESLEKDNVSIKIDLIAPLSNHLSIWWIHTIATLKSDNAKTTQINHSPPNQSTYSTQNSSVVVSYNNYWQGQKVSLSQICLSIFEKSS